MRRSTRPRPAARWGVRLLVLGVLIGGAAWWTGYLPIQVLQTETGTLSDDARKQRGADSDAANAIDVDAEVSAEVFEQQSEPPVAEGDNRRESIAQAPERPKSPQGAGSSERWDDPTTPQLAANLPDSVGGTTSAPGGSATGQTFDTGNRVSSNGGGSAVSHTTIPVSQKTGDAAPTERASSAVPAKIQQFMDQGKYLQAHRELSMLYWKKPELRSAIRERIETTARSIYFAPQPHYLTPYEVQPGDQLRRIAKKYDVPWRYLARLNRIEPRKIRAGDKLKVIRGPFSAFVDLSDFEITIHNRGYYVCRFPVGIGKEGTTPLGKFSVKEKLTNPTYYGPDGNVIDKDDPENPLGEYWIGIGDGYGLHGTIEPDSIGKAESRGCIRLRSEDVEVVYDLLGVGSEVVIRR